MKRKRGHKKGKAKGTPVAGANETVKNAESQKEMSGLNEFGNDKYDSGMEVDTPSSTGTDQHYNLANINPDGSLDKSAGKSVGRVKVKLRTSKMLDSQPTSSDAPTQSDTDKSSQHHGFEKHGLNAERTEDSANSLPEMKSAPPSKKAGSIKIKSSKVLGSSSNQTGKGLPLYPKEPNTPQQSTQYNKQELDAALTVIKKVMKMDAAEPFNVPVNPEALGIPDYFDVIDTPMDFGTICSNLERDDKYMNSEDVYKDVQYIWDNCYKYNNKGDYILDLMRRVKKSFMKYWTAAGLYSEQTKGAAESGEGKVVKGGMKQKSKKRHGRRHKHDCLCAICVLKRRRKEREENERIAKGIVGSGGDKLAKGIKQEESMLVESAGGEDSSSNGDDSMGTDADAEEDKEEEVKMEVPSEGKHEDLDDGDDGDDDDDDNDQEDEEDGEEDGEETETGLRKKHKGEKSSVGDVTDVQDGYTIMQEGQVAAGKQQKHKESQYKQQRAKLFEKFGFENPQLSNLCGILFPKNRQSVWNGPHSLNNKHQISSRSSSIHAAVETSMK